ncbi:MAG: hypothetical protein ACTS41_01055 [Candidatus Hodgkinia cicadicola]
MKLCKCAPHSPLSPSFVNSKVGGGAFDEFPAPPTFQTKDEGGRIYLRREFGSFLRREGGRNVRTMRKRNCSAAFAFAAASEGAGPLFALTTAAWRC